MDTADPRAAGQGNSPETQPKETLLVLHQDRRECLQAEVLGSPPGMSCKVRVGNEAPTAPESCTPGSLSQARQGLCAARREEALKESTPGPQLSPVTTGLLLANQLQAQTSTVPKVLTPTTTPSSSLSDCIYHCGCQHLPRPRSASMALSAEL